MQPADLDLGPYYKLPSYNTCQVLSEMAAHEIETCLFVCYTPQSTTLCKVQFDENLWKGMLKLSEKLYGADRVKVPTTLDEETWKLRDDVVTFARNNSYFLCVVPSLISGKEPIP